MRLLSDHIHAAPVPIPYVGRVLLPDSVSLRQNYSLWTVLQVGPGRVNHKGVRIPMEVAVGDRLICQFHHDHSDRLSDGTAILGREAVLALIPKQP